MSIAVKITCVIFLIILLPMSNAIMAQQEALDPQPSDNIKGKVEPAPDLADLVPLATELSTRLAVLEKRMLDGLDVAAVEKSYPEIIAKIEKYSVQLQKVTASGKYRYEQLIELKVAIQYESASLLKATKSFDKEIRKVGASRENWLYEKKRWNEWKSSLLKDEPLDEVKLIFAKMKDTIDTALNLILACIGKSRIPRARRSLRR